MDIQVISGREQMGSGHELVETIMTVAGIETSVAPTVGLTAEASASAALSSTGDAAADAESVRSNAELFQDSSWDDEPDGFGEDDGEKTVVSAIPFELRARFTGRHAPITQLTDLMESVLQGGSEGFAIIVGDPGMGKTRAIAELVRRTKAAHPTVRVLAGTTDDVTLPYGPVARALALRYGLTPGESDTAARERIVAGIAEVVPAQRVVELAHLVAHVLRVPFADSPVVGPLVESPQRLETRIFMALRRLLIAEAAHQPLVIALEDLHKCGPDTINLVHYLVAGLRSAPVLIVATATSELFENHPSFGEGDIPVTRVDLGAMPADDAEALARTLLSPLDTVPARVISHARSLGGSPRAIHELVRLLLESDCIVRGGGATWRVDDEALARTTLPRTYDQLVATRLAVMPATLRRTLEMAATVGEVAWLDAVVAIDRTQSSTVRDPDGPTLSQIAATADQSRIEVSTAIAQLVEREWLVDIAQSSLPGERELRFSYPHLWSLIYAGIEDGRRRSYHATAARWLELRSRDESVTGPSSPHAIARHLELAGEARAAAGRFRQAAEAARAQYRNEQAIRYFDRALACIGDTDIAARVSLWHDLGSVYELIGDFEAALGAFERMLRLSWLAASKTKAAVAFNKMGRVWRRKGDLALALEYLERGLDLFRTADDARGIAGSLDDIGKTLHLLGRYDEALANITEALARRGVSGDPRSIASSLSNLGVIQHDRGEFVAAATCHREALELRKKAGDRSGMVGSQNNLAVLSFELGDQAAARTQWIAALADAETIGALPMSAIILNNLGELALREQKVEESRSRLEDALEIIEDIEDRHLETECCRLLAELEQRCGRLAEARELAARALSVAAKAGLREKLAQAHLRLAEIQGSSLFNTDSVELSSTTTTLAPTASVTAEAPATEHYQRAEQILRNIGNRNELAKALESYGRFLIERGDQAAGKVRLIEAQTLLRDLGLLTKASTIEALLANLA